MACAVGVEGGGKLIVRNTFLELFDETKAAEDGCRRPRAQTDMTGSKLSKNMQCSDDEAVAEDEADSKQSGTLPAMPDGSPGSSPHNFMAPSGDIPRPYYQDYDYSSASYDYASANAAASAAAGMHSWWEYQAAMQQYATGQAAGFSPYYFPGTFPGYPYGPAGAPAGMSAAEMPTAVSSQSMPGVPQTMPGVAAVQQQQQQQQQQGAQTEWKAKGARGDKEKAVKGQQPTPSSAEQSAGAAGSANASAGAAVDEEPSPENATTIMMRNIPNGYTQSILLNLLEDNGFRGRFDFVYLPMDFRNGVNLGYAFVNLLTHQEALKLKDLFHGFTKWCFDSAKVCEVSWAHPHQGLVEHVERYKNSPVMHPSTPDEYKPMIFQNGMRIAFPPPSKVIRAPKLRPVRERGDKAGPQA